MNRTIRKPPLPSWEGLEKGKVAGKIPLLFIQLFAFWPVWKWYIRKLLDPSTNPYVVIALGTALVLIFLNRSQHPPTTIPLIIPTMLLLLYAGTFHAFPPLLRAVIAVMALACTLQCFGIALQPGTLGLLLLALPIIPLMQLYLGYPYRIICGKLAAIFLQLIGFPVTFEGITFNRCGGDIIWLDELCSGIRNVWAGLYLTFTLAAFYHLGTKKTLTLTGFSLLMFFGVNIVRLMVLGHAKMDNFVLPWWIHKGGFIVAFLVASMIILWFIQKVDSLRRAKS